MVNQVGIEQVLFSQQMALLRSWVQIIPPGPLLSFWLPTVLIRGYFWIVAGQFKQQCHCYANNNINSNALNGGFQQLQTTIF